MDAVDNVSLREAVAGFAAEPGPETYAKVLRELFQGALLMDVTGSDIRMSPDGGTMEAGSTLRIVGGTGPDGKPAFFAFTRQEEAQKMHPDEQVVTMGQPSDGMLQMALDQGTMWLYIDADGPTCAISPDHYAPTLATPYNVAVKTALAVADSKARREAVIAALGVEGSLLLAVRSDGAGGYQLRTTVGPDGQARLLAFTSQLEMSAVDPDPFEFVSHTVDEVIANALDGSFAGLVLNPAGPWIEISTDELRKVKKSH